MGRCGERGRRERRGWSLVRTPRWCVCRRASWRESARRRNSGMVARALPLPLPLPVSATSVSTSTSTSIGIGIGIGIGSGDRRGATPAIGGVCGGGHGHNRADAGATRRASSGGGGGAGYRGTLRRRCGRAGGTDRCSCAYAPPTSASTAPASAAGANGAGSSQAFDRARARAATPHVRSTLRASRARVGRDA